MNRIKWNIILLAVTIGLFSSCITQKKCNERFPPTTEIIYKDSISERDSIVEKIVEVPVYVKGDTVTKTDTVWRDKKTGLATSKPIYAETDFSKAAAQVKDGKITLTLIQKDSLFKLQVKAKEAYYWKNQYTKEKIKDVVVKKEVPKFYSVMAMVGIGLSTLLISYIIYKIRNKFKLSWPR